MNFLVRGARNEDLNSLYELAKQFSLLNMPADKTVLADKISRSIDSFAGRLNKEHGQYLFVSQEIDTGRIAGCSSIIAKHGTEDNPHVYFQVMQRERFSENLGLGFIHQVLRFHQDFDGPSEIGGLLVDKAYRGRPEKLGKLISLMRFAFMGLKPELFEDRILCELSPPLTEDGKSEFWEALGRRFTGLPYPEADALSQQDKEFITSLFPDTDIYTCLLDSKARLVMGRVGEKTRPAQHLLEKVGFKYLHEVDPFDGGPHYAVQRDQIKLISEGQTRVVEKGDEPPYEKSGFVAVLKEGQFIGGQSHYRIFEDNLYLPPRTFKVLNLQGGEKAFVAPVI